VNEKVTIGALARMKRDGKKIVGVVAWDYQIAAIADRAGVEIVSVGDSYTFGWGLALEDHAMTRFMESYRRAHPDRDGSQARDRP